MTTNRTLYCKPSHTLEDRENKNDGNGVSGQNTLLDAILNNNEVLCLTLIDTGSDVKVIDKQGRNALFYSARIKNEKVTCALIDAGADVNAIDQEGQNALFYSARYGNEKVTCALIDAGVDVSVINKDGQNALFYFARYGNEKVTCALIDAGADVNVIDEQGQNALFYSVSNENEKVTCALIDAGADVNVIDKQGRNALFYSARNENEKVTCALIDAGADVSVIDKEGQNALFYSARNGNEKVTCALIDAGADFNVIDKQGQNVLFYAALFNKVNVVRLLIDAGANVNVIDSWERSILFYVVKTDKEDMVRTLIEVGVNVNVVDFIGKSVLFNAVQHNNENIVRTLIDAGVNVNVIDHEGRNVLFDAVKHDNENIVRALIVAGVDVNIIDYEGKSVLFDAVEHYNENIVRTLIDAGIGVNVIDKKGQNALFRIFNKYNKNALLYTSLNSFENVVRVLIDTVVDVNVIDKQGQTALFNAVQYNSENVVRALIDAGVDVNVIDIQGKTALFNAVQYNKENVVRALIDNGADVDIIDKQGQTALFNAVQCNNENVVRALINAGVDVNVFDKQGQTALFNAVQCNNESVVRALIDAGVDVNVIDKEAQNALFNAVQYNTENVVRALIDAGADVNVIDKQGQTALFKTSITDKYGQNVLFTAAQIDNEKVTRALINAGADVNVIDKQEKPVLFYAVKNDRKNVVRTLIDSGADLNIVVNEGGQLPTALFVALKLNEENVARLLIDAGADLTVTDKQGGTALFYAVHRENDNLVRALIDAGADVNKTDNKGKTVLFHVDRSSMASTLIDYGGAEVDARDSYGRTPLFYAITNRYPATFVDLASYLLERGATPTLKDINNADVSCFFLESCIKGSFVFSTTGRYKVEDICERFYLLTKYEVKKKTVFKTIINAVFCFVVFLVSYSCDVKDFEYLCSLLELAKKYIAKEEKQKNEIIENVVMEMKRTLHDEELFVSLLPTFLSALRKLGANPNSADIHGNTVAHHTTRLPFAGVPLETMMEVCHQLKNFGVNFFAKNKQNESPFLFCLSGNYKKMEKHHSESTLKCFEILVEVWRFYLKHGSIWNEITKTGESVYHLSLNRLIPFYVPVEGNYYTVSRCKYDDVLPKIAELLQLYSTRNLNKVVIVNQRDVDLYSPLHIWALYDGNVVEGYITIFRHLLECGAQLNVSNKNEETPLHLCKTWTAVKLLIDHGANTEVVDSKGRKPFFNAMKMNTLWLENRGLVFRDVSEEPKEFWKSVLEKKLEPWAVDKDGESVMSVLVELRQFVHANALLEIARDNKCLQSDTIAASLLNAICKGKTSHANWRSNLVDIILKARKNYNFLNEGGKDLPLHFCCRNIVTQETQAKMTTEKSEQNIFWTIAKQLLRYGADCTIPDDTGQSCLDIAEACSELKDLLAKPVDFDEIPLLIPWTPVSKRYKQNLAKVARRQECEHVDSFWYHKDHLGCGSFGFVFAGINEKDGREVAIKRMETLRMDRREDVREIANLKVLADCEQVVCYLSFFEDDVSHFSYVVLELMEGNLDEYLDNFYDPNENVKLCKNVVIGLDFLHNLNILHRDLKPTNILYKTHPKLCLKIADFGLSRRIDSCSTTVYGTNAGTRCWIAPEVFKDLDDHCTSSDIFACGLLIHYILSKKRHPFAPDDCTKKSLLLINTETEINVMKNDMKGWDNSIGPEAADLILKMLFSDKSQRPSAAEALTHPWFWSEKKKLDLLTAVGNQPEFECPRAKRSLPLTAFETDLETKFTTISKYANWNDPGYLHMPAIYSEMTKKRKSYDTHSLVDLVRFIRNAIAHVSERTRPASIRKQLLEDFVFLEYFPDLVIEVYKAITTYGWDQRKEIKYAMKD